MNFLRDSWGFLVREKRWTGLFILTVLLYGGIFYWHAGRPQSPPSPALEEFRAAEMKLKEEIRMSGNIQKFLVQRPKLFMIFNIFTFLILGTVIAGLVLDMVWLVRPDWRRRLRVSESPPETGKWGISAIFRVLVLFFLVSFALSVFLSLLRAAIPQMSPNFLILLHTTLADLLCVVLIVYFIRQLGGHWKDLGFHGVNLWKDLKVGFTGYLAVLPPFFLVLIGLITLANFFAYEPPAHPLVEIFLEEEKQAPSLVAYSVFLACVIGPVLEEIFFRGFCYPAFKKRWGRGWGLVLSAAFFGLIHQNYFAFLPIFVLGLSLGYLYEKRGTLVPSIVLHIVHNSIFVAYFFIAKEALMAI